MLLEHIDEPGLNRIDVYERLGGYGPLRKALLEMTPEAVLHELEESGLRGRGGAGFSMGKKASFIPKGAMDKYLCCNADESEPGTFKDRLLMQKNPHMLIEGCVIGAIAAGANKGFIFIRGEYTLQADILDAALAEAYERGYLGERILGSEHSFDLVVHRGKGAYICGEETALLDALEGKRGNPRLKPPFPANQGLYQGPTLINNVETLCNAPAIIARGGEWFHSLGVGNSTGTKLVSVSGNVQRPGNYEIELGISAREIVYGLAGGPPEGRDREVLVPRRLLGAGAARGAPGPALHVRGHGTGGLHARLRRRDRGGRLAAARAARAAPGRVLPPRVVRQVRALPRGHELDREDAGAGGLRGGHAHGPRDHGPGPGEHHGELPLRARRLDGDADRVDAEPLQGGVRAAHRARPRPPRPRGNAGGRLMARPEVKLVTFEIDGKEVQAPQGTMLVDAAKHGDVEIPYFCYEPKLGQPVGACRMCLVEIEGIPKLQTSCSTPVRDGMVVVTTSDRVRHAQEAVVEFLLVNHPLDCPVCDKGGECPLQDISFGWGAGRSRVIDPKRHFKKPLELSPLVAIDRERCILCYRCVRFSQEVAEDHQLVFLERGDHTFVGTHDGRPYVGPFSGNIIELCPVGALTSTSYRFRARPVGHRGRRKRLRPLPLAVQRHAHDP